MNTFQRSNPARSIRAFTLVELLAVIGIIALLISILGVAFSGALAAGRNAATESLLRNIQTGVQQFENDFGYLPPLVDGSKRTLDSIEDPMEQREELINHRFHSVYSLPLYLLGVGELAPIDEDLGPNDKPDRHDGKQGPGFRDPGVDRSWGGARNRAKHRAPTTGRVFGPYLDIGGGEDVLRKVELRDLVLPDNADPEDFFADGDDTGMGADGVGDLFVFTDRWDNAIRFYKGWPTREGDGNGLFRPSLNTIPLELRTQDSMIQHLTAPLSTGADPLLDPDLLRTPYALLSAGPDGDFGDTDAGGVWINSGDFFMGADDPDKINVIKRIKDNIRTTP